jgi:stage III sporulation protein SpoIIIAA
MAKLDEELQKLLEILPPRIKQSLKKIPEINSLVEIVIDLGKPLEVRFENKVFYVPGELAAQQDIEYVVSKVSHFTSDNRAGIERTLHRISCIRNRMGKIIGLTLRVGRSILGTIDIIRDVIESGKNTLFMGPPGIGKTTKLREAARVLSDQFNKRVVVVDTSNEIAGDGDIPHPGIGKARRMQVSSPELQHKVMIEAVENHMPEVIIVDEIGTELEAGACRTIAERGVQLIGTAHGILLENIVSNPTLSDLVGGVQSVILGDEEAKKPSAATPRRRSSRGKLLLPLISRLRSGKRINLQSIRMWPEQWIASCATGYPSLRYGCASRAARSRSSGHRK